MSRSYPVKGAPLSDFARSAKADIDDTVRLLTETGSLSIVGNGNAAKRYGEDKFVIGGFEGPLKGGPVAVVVVDHAENVHEGELSYHHEEVLPLYSAIGGLRSGQIVRVMPEYRSHVMNIYALYPSRQYLDAKIRTWVDFLRDELPATLEADEAALAQFTAAT